MTETVYDDGAAHRARRAGSRRRAPPRLVATDLDGTLLHSDGPVTARTRAVLAELDERGVPVVFATGRPIRWMEDALGRRRRARPGDL